MCCPLSLCSTCPPGLRLHCGAKAMKDDLGFGLVPLRLGVDCCMVVVVCGLRSLMSKSRMEAGDLRNRWAHTHIHISY